MYIGQFFGYLPSASYLISFPHLVHPETLPRVCLHLSAKMDLQLKASGRSKTHYGLHYPLTFDPQGTFLHICSVSLVPKGRSGHPLILYSKRGFAPLCPCMTIPLRCLKETNTIYPVSVISIVESKEEASCTYTS